MSTELYLVCRKDARCVHVGTRYGFGTRLLTIGPSKQAVALWLDDHAECAIELGDEHHIDEIVEDE